jgi:DnaJ like chaperone protein
MYWRGKLIGLFFGLLIFRNPLAAIIGFLVGHYFDKGLGSASLRHQQGFLETLFSVMGYIAKSDGRVSEKELQNARDVMERLYLTAEQRQIAMLAFSRGRQSYFNMETALRELQRVYAHQPSQIKLFFTLQIQAAHEDGYISRSKQQVLQHIAQMLGITFSYSTANERSYHQHQQSHQYRSSSEPAFASISADDYALLNITRAASDAEIKKAYRRLMSQHHPDKQAAKGLSPAKLKEATEKTQQIKAAYDRIRAARGM